MQSKQTKNILFTGIQRQAPGTSEPDGGCNEIINARHHGGAWRPVGRKKEVTPSYLSNEQTLFRHHVLPDDYSLVVDGQLNTISLKKTV